MDFEKRIAQIKKEIRETPKHKATEHHLGGLRAKLSKLEKRLEASQKSKGGGLGFAVKKSGDATVVLVGPPSVGKSTLINQITSAHSPVGDFDFTTLTVIPGMLNYKGAHIQVLDVPGLIGGAAKGKGRGREVLSVIRNADLILLMVDNQKIDQLPALKKELQDAYIEDKPMIVVINKSDLLPQSQLKKLKKQKVVLISALKKQALNELKEAIFEALELIRVYLKPPKGQPDYENPLIVKRDTSVARAAEMVSKELENSLETAQVWGASVKYPGQYVSLNHILQDEDVLSLIKK
jgi:small GTP-binding protein